MKRKHHQMTKTPKKVSRNSGGCWKFTSPACLRGSVGSQGAGAETDEPRQSPLAHRKRTGQRQGGFLHVREPPSHPAGLALFLSKPRLPETSGSVLTEELQAVLLQPLRLP